MNKTKVNYKKRRMKEKAYQEFSLGKYTQRELADKYDICETELSRFFSKKYSLIEYGKQK